MGRAPHCASLRLGSGAPRAPHVFGHSACSGLAGVHIICPEIMCIGLREEENRRRRGEGRRKQKENVELGPARISLCLILVRKRENRSTSYLDLT